MSHHRDKTTDNARALLAHMPASFGPLERVDRLDYLEEVARKPETRAVIARAREIVRNGR